MKRLIVWILGSLLALFILALILAPGIARRYAMKHSQELIGRSLSIDQLQVNYASTKLRITGFILYEADNTRPFVSFDTLELDLKPLRLVREELYVQRLYLSGLRAFAMQEDSTFNFSDLADKFSPESSGDTLDDPDEEEAFAYHLHDLELSKARFEYENRNIEDTLILRNVSFAIPYVGWDQQEKSEASLRLNLEHEAYLEAKMNLNPAAGAFDMWLSLQEMRLNGYSKLLSTYTEIDSVKGSFDATLEVSGNINEPENALVSGNVALQELAFSDQGKQFLGARSIRLLMQEVDLSQSKFYLDSVVLEHPYAYVELRDSTNNFFELLGYTPPDSEESEGRPATADSIAPHADQELVYAIQAFRFEDGIIEFRDQTTGTPFDYHLSEVNISMDSIESSAQRVSVFASMLLNERGKLMAETSFDPLSPANLTLDYTITDFQLSDLNIYSRYYMGFPILYGEMFYRGHTEVVDHQLVSENRLVMDHVELGEKTGGLNDLPLKFALYILKDRNNVIDLEIPVRGLTDDPQLSVGKIVWNTVKNLLVRTAAAPYDFLSDLLGVDPGDIEAIEFAYGDTLLSAEMQKQLDLMLELEEIKPFMEIELYYYNDPEREAKAILMQDLGLDSMEIRALAPTAPVLMEADSVVSLHGQTRHDIIENYLHSASDSTQIILSASDPRDPLNVGSQPRFEMRYSLKDAELE